MDIEIINRGRGPEFKGTRITVFDVFHYQMDATWTDEEIALTLRLSLEQVRAAISYIKDHKTEVEETHRKIEDRIARGNPHQIGEKLAGSRAKRDRLIQQIRHAREEKNGARDTC